MIGRDTFHLTQEFLSHMLGVRRTSVSIDAHALQEAGLIRYRRGQVTILKRNGLEDCACECYSVIRAETDKLMGAAKSNRAFEIRLGSGKSAFRILLGRPGLEF
jgi:hypothetical protein